MVRVDMNEEKSEGVPVWWGGQGGCERRIEVIVKMKKKSGGGGVVSGGGVGWGGKASVDVKLKLL